MFYILTFLKTEKFVKSEKSIFSDVLKIVRTKELLIFLNKSFKSFIDDCFFYNSS